MGVKVDRAWQPEQGWSLPPSPRDWLLEGPLVYFLMDAVRELDLGSITSCYERALRGDPPFDPRLMLTLLIHCQTSLGPSVRHLNVASFRQNVGLFRYRPALWRGAATSHRPPRELYSDTLRLPWVENTATPTLYVSNH